MSRGRDRRRPAAFARWLVAGWLAVALGASDVGGADDPEELARHLLVMINGQLAGEDTIGAGIIAGTGPGRLYVATANHVVRRGAQTVERLRVQFRSLPGESFEARLGDHYDAALDLAVLVVPDVARHNIPIDRIPFESLGAPEALAQGDPVFPMGYPRGSAWRRPVRADAMASPASGDRLAFESSFIARGHSGGGLFTEGWALVGLIQADEPPEGRALSITKVVATLREWGYPVNLQPARQAPPGDETVTPRGPDRTPPTAAGRLCVDGPDLDPGVTLVVSGGGRRLEVDAGQCIEVQPGSYTVAVAEVDVPTGSSCQPASVDVVPGESTRARPSCALEVAGGVDISGDWSLAMGGQVVSRLTFRRVPGGFGFDYVEFNILGQPVGLGKATVEQGTMRFEGQSGGHLVSGQFAVETNSMVGQVRGLLGTFPAILWR